MTSPPDLLNSALIRLTAAAASGLMLWYGTGLHPVWWLIWIAPLPVLCVAARAKPASAFFIAFGAWAAGAMNMWSYLYGLLGVPLGVAVLADLGPALVFAFAVLIWRAYVRRGDLIPGPLSFAAIWVSYEFAIQKLSVHSTFGNLAYTQMDCLPVLQTAAITGVAGISFLLFFIPAAAAAMLSPGRAARQRRLLGALTLTLAVLVIGWGALRLRAQLTGPTVMVGLIASDIQANLRPHDAGQIQRTFGAYADSAKSLVGQGARVIVIPEKNAVVSGDTVGLVDEILSGASANGVTVAAGVERWTDNTKLNEIRLYRDGQLQETYEKHHMLPPFESYLLPGTSLTTVLEPSGTWGLEICKDMDFPSLSRQYGKAGIGLLLVPAWDFDADGWYHGRMAVMRGVESGFSIARAPKQGILTVSDDRGRVLAERQSSAADFSTLLATAPVHHDVTLYDRWGDWFGWLNVGLLGGVLGVMFINVVRPRFTKAT